MLGKGCSSKPASTSRLHQYYKHILATGSAACVDAQQDLETAQDKLLTHKLNIIEGCSHQLAGSAVPGRVTTKVQSGHVAAAA